MMCPIKKGYKIKTIIDNNLFILVFIVNNLFCFYIYLNQLYILNKIL
jgi:hypothetical protein